MSSQPPPVITLQITFCILATSCSLTLYTESPITRPVLPAAAGAAPRRLLPPALAAGQLAHALAWRAAKPGAPACRPCCRTLWQVVMAVIGISIHALVVSTVLPVTSHAIVQRQFAAALGQLAAVADQTVADLLPDDGSRGGSTSRGGSSRGSSGGANSGSSIGSPRGPPPAPPPLASKREAGGHPSSPQAAVGTHAPPSAFQQPAQLAPVPASPPATPPATPPGTPPVRHANRRRLALAQQSSLIALPPEPSTLGGGSRREAARALRQLHEPQGPALAEEAEALLGPIYSRLLRRSWPVGCLAAAGGSTRACLPRGGPGFNQLSLVLPLQANAAIAGLTPIISTLRFEWRLLARPHRLSADAAFSAQRLCRCRLRPCA